jgi:hypothetical protein
LLVWLAGCAQPDSAPGVRATQVATLANGDIREASGMTRSSLDDSLLWVINDSGSLPLLYAVGIDGRDRGTIRVDNARNTDWEGLASFEADGKAWLLVADIGDNSGKRQSVDLYLFEEPKAPLAATVRARRVSFSYPNGPRDAEAVAVDVADRQALIMTKRTIPPELYAVPLDAPRGANVVAVRLGTVAGLPRPTPRDIALAPDRQDWHWQPTGMDISPDGTSIAVLTYRALYVFRRQPGTGWIDALHSPAHRQQLVGLRNAEAIAFAHASDDLYVTTEQRFAPLHRFARPH